MKRATIFCLLAALILACTGCGAGEPGTTQATAASGEAAADPAALFTDRDLGMSYDAQNCVRITLEGSAAACDSDSVSIDDSTVTITGAGTYLLSGTLDDGMVIIDAEKTDKIQLVLDGVTIHSADSAAIYVLKADKVFVTTAADSVNTLSNGGDYIAKDNNIDGVVFSKEDLTLNGAGKLTITAAAGHGVVSKDDLVLAGGTYEITAEKRGLSGKDSVRIADGDYTIRSGKDGIHAENKDDASLGFVAITGGTLDLTCNSSDNTALDWDGTYENTGGAITTNDGSENNPGQTGGKNRQG